MCCVLVQDVSVYDFFAKEVNVIDVSINHMGEAGGLKDVKIKGFNCYEILMWMSITPIPSKLQPSTSSIV